MDILNLREILVKAVLLAANTTFDSYHVSTTSPGTGRLSALQHSSRDREAFLLHLDQRQLHLCIPGLFEAACRPTCRNVAKLHDHNKYQCFFCIELQKCCKAHSFGTPKGACRGAEWLRTLIACYLGKRPLSRNNGIVFTCSNIRNHDCHVAICCYHHHCHYQGVGIDLHLVHPGSVFWQSAKGSSWFL